MKLDVTTFRYITKDEFRVLTAVEMAMRNHELAPVPLIESIAKGNRGLVYKLLQSLLRNKLIAHDGKQYDGYRLTYHGYDYLALRALVLRGTITGVGRRLGVGKESDVHFCQGAEGQTLAIKLHRLGRISFRNIKAKRDYLKHREHASWQYMARLAALKEFAYMKALKDEGFPVPTPIDQNRHAVVMSFVDAVPLYRVRALQRPHAVLERLMRLLVRLAHAGIIHGDFNEFNLMIDRDEKVTLIDFPQIVHIGHANAEEYFDRDAQCVCDFFRKRLNIEVQQWPAYSEVIQEAAPGSAGGPALALLAVEGLDREGDALLVRAHAEGEQHRAEGGRRDGGGDSEAEGSESDTSRSGGEPGEAFEQLAPAAPRKEEDATQEVEEKEEVDDDDDDEMERLGEGASPEAAPEAVPESASQLQDDGEAGAGDALAGERGAGEAGSNERDAVEAGSSESEADEERPGQVSISSGKRRNQRRPVTAKEARRNLQKQQKTKPARANDSKNKELRRAKSEVKEYLG